MALFVQNAKCGKNREGGFTILEVMIALTIFAIVAISITLAIASSARSSEHAQDWTAAYKATQKVMEEVMSLEYSEIPLQDGVTFQVLSTTRPVTGTIVVEDIGPTWGGPAGSAYQVTITIDDAATDIQSSLTTVRSAY